MNKTDGLVDTIKEENFLHSIGRGLKKSGRAIYQTIRQSPDADLCLIGATGSLFMDNMEVASIILGAVSAKQYIWGWLSYNDVQKAIESRDGQISVEALKKRFSFSKEGPCNYFGARYAIKEYQRSLEENIE